MRRVFLVLIALVFVGLLGAGWYASERGLTRKWRGFVSGEFRKRGLEVSLRRLALDPFRGFVAREVKIYDSKERRRTLAVIDDIRLVINYANLLRGEPFLEALDLREARLALPVDTRNPRGAAIEVNNLSGRLLLPPQQVHLSRLEAELHGMRVSASGVLIYPKGFRLQEGDVRQRRLVEVVEQWVRELKALRFEQEPPHLDLRFGGNLAEPDTIFFEGTLRARKLRRATWRIEQLDAEASFRQGVLELRQLHARDSRGSLTGGGRWQAAQGTGSAHLVSTMDLRELALALRIPGPLRECVFGGAPVLDLSLKTERHSGQNPEVSTQILGRVQAQTVTYRSVAFDRVTADFSWRDGAWSVRDLRLAQPRGEITGDVLRVPGDFRIRLRSDLFPQTLAPLLPAAYRDALGQWNFREPPRIQLEIRGPEPDWGSCVATAEVQLGRTLFRNVAAENLTATVRYEKGLLSVEPFRLRRSEGGASGGVFVDFKKQEVQLRKIEAAVFPSEVMQWFAPGLVEDVAPYRFPRRAPSLWIDGVVHIARGKTTKLTIDVDSKTGMDYTFAKKPLSSPQVSARLLFTDRRLQISGLSAALWGGRLKGEADFALVPGKPSYSATFRLENVDFASLTRLYLNYDNSKGRIDGVYHFTGRGADPRSLTGDGSLSVRDGDVFAIPFLGPISGILNGIVPGMGQDVAKNATAQFHTEGGVVDVKNLLVEGSGFSLLGGGKLRYLEDSMDFDVRINARGLPGVVLFPVSKLFEYVADEKLSKPRWRPKALPRLGPTTANEPRTPGR
jgi:hypothetical protein